LAQLAHRKGGVERDQDQFRPHSPRHAAPRLADQPPPHREAILDKFGFNQLGASPNYSRHVPAGSLENLRHAALLAFHTLQFAYGVTDFSCGSFTLNIP